MENLYYSRFPTANSDRVEQVLDRCRVVGWNTFVLNAGSAFIAFSGQARVFESAEMTILVFGSFYPRSNACERRNESSLESLMASHWGKFVVCELNKKTGEVRFATDHLGAKPCYFTASQDSLSVFLNLNDHKYIQQCLPELDWQYLASQVAFAQISTDETAFQGIRQLPPASLARISGCRIQVAPYWSPVIVANESMCKPGSERECGEMLKSAIEYSVKQQSSGHLKALTFLSGGLDSAVVTSCVVNELGADSVVGFNVSDESAIGDESLYATVLADHLGVQLSRHRLNAKDYRLLDELHGKLRPVPHKYGTGFEILNRADEVAKENGLSAAFSGVGGDAIYLAGHNSKYVHDYLKTIGLRGIWGKIEETAYMSHKTVWQVCYELWEFSYSKKKKKISPYQNYINRSFLSSKACESISIKGMNNTWVNEARHLPRGKQHQILNLIATSHANSDTTRSDGIEVFHPLLSVPVVEACLKIPTFILSGKNIDRSLVRHTFAKDIPSQIAWRRTKGGGGAFYYDLISNEKARIKTYLADGVLASLEVIDADKVSISIDSLSDGTTYETHTKLFELVITEAWARAVAANE